MAEAVSSQAHTQLKTGFTTRPVYLGFVADIVAKGQVFLPVRLLFSVNIIL
jgi:hypothetical protein